jgi:hypothetical protein
MGGARGRCGAKEKRILGSGEGKITWKTKV